MHQEYALDLSTTAVVIQPAGFRDLSAVINIQRESFRPGLAYGRFALIALWMLPMATFLVLKDPSNDEVLGNVIADRQGGNTRIINVAVGSRFRRQGLGRQLLRAIDQRCPHGDLVLAVEQANKAAQRLYEDEGFVRTASMRDYYGRGQHGYTMKKVRGARQTSISAP